MTAIPAPNSKEPIPPRESGGFSLLPIGWYRAQIIEAKVKPLGSGNGAGLNLEVAILSPGYVNRKVWTTINANHTNPDAERIGQQQLQELIEAVGLTRETFQHDYQINSKQLLIKLKIQEARGEYPARNQISGFAPWNAEKTLVPPPSGPAGRPGGAPPPAAGGRPPPAQSASGSAPANAGTSPPPASTSAAPPAGKAPAPWLR